MGRDLGLTAKPDAGWHHVQLTVEQVRNDTLRTLAEAWAEDRDRVAAVLDHLAAALPGPVEAWDSATLDLESDLQMDRPEISLDETQALQLADELRESAGKTVSRFRGAPVALPDQQDRRAAA